MEINPEKISSIMEEFDKKKVAIIGDFCLDEYILGDTNRISPEAPIPRVIIENKKYVPGAAGNVACGVRALGADTYPIGVIGNDINGNILLEEFKKRGIRLDGMIIDENRSTPTYSRVVAGGERTPPQQLVRFDVENSKPISRDSLERSIDFLKKIVEQIDAIIVADYSEVSGLGIATPNILKTVAELAKKHNKVLVGDSRCNIGEFKGFTFVVPNDLEASKGSEIEMRNENDLEKSGNALLNKIGSQAVVVTRGKDGMSVFERKNGKTGLTYIPAVAKNVVDVTGAGDTVTVMMTLSVVSGASFIEAATLGSYATAVTVSKEGTVSVTRGEVKNLMMHSNDPNVSRKIYKLKELTSIVKNYQKEGKKVVFTNGYFDPIHVGHIKLLSNAKKHGDILVVALNSDNSVRANKGFGRPFMSEKERTQIVSSLDFVDYIVLYPELTPINILSSIRPDVLVKGDNYSLEEVVGRDLLESYGGKVVLLPMVKGVSSDLIVEAVKSTKKWLK